MRGDGRVLIRAGAGLVKARTVHERRFGAKAAAEVVVGILAIGENAGVPVAADIGFVRDAEARFVLGADWRDEPGAAAKAHAAAVDAMLINWAGIVAAAAVIAA